MGAGSNKYINVRIHNEFNFVRKPGTNMSQSLLFNACIKMSKKRANLGVTTISFSLFFTRVGDKEIVRFDRDPAF